MSESLHGEPKGKFEVIGNYILGEDLGSGTFGVVRKARHIHSGESVAVKRLEKAKETAEKAIKLMEDKNIWKADNDVAEKAMKSAIEVMESQHGTTDSKLKAAKVILEFTQTKPVVKNETTLKSAEDFLTALMHEEDVDGAKP